MPSTFPLSLADWTRWLLNLDASELEGGATWTLRFHWLPESWQVFVTVALAGAALALVAFLYIKEAANISPFLRTVLVALRIGAIALAAFLITGPYLQPASQIQTDSTFLILVIDRQA